MQRRLKTKTKVRKDIKLKYIFKVQNVIKSFACFEFTPAEPYFFHCNICDILSLSIYPQFLNKKVIFHLPNIGFSNLYYPPPCLLSLLPLIFLHYLRHLIFNLPMSPLNHPVCRQQRKSCCNLT